MIFRSLPQKALCRSSHRSTHTYIQLGNVANGQRHKPLLIQYIYNIYISWYIFLIRKTCNRKSRILNSTRCSLSQNSFTSLHSDLFLSFNSASNQIETFNSVSAFFIIWWSPLVILESDSLCCSSSCGRNRLNKQAICRATQWAWKWVWSPLSASLSPAASDRPSYKSYMYMAWLFRKAKVPLTPAK